MTKRLFAHHDYTNHRDEYVLQLLPAIWDEEDKNTFHNYTNHSGQRKTDALQVSPGKLDGEDPFLPFNPQPVLLTGAFAALPM